MYLHNSKNMYRHNHNYFTISIFWPKTFVFTVFILNHKQRWLINNIFLSKLLKSFNIYEQPVHLRSQISEKNILPASRTWIINMKSCQVPVIILMSRWVGLRVFLIVNATDIYSSPVKRRRVLRQRRHFRFRQSGAFNLTFDTCKYKTTHFSKIRVDFSC